MVLLQPKPQPPQFFTTKPKLLCFLISKYADLCSFTPKTTTTPWLFQRVAEPKELLPASLVHAKQQPKLNHHLGFSALGSMNEIWEMGGIIVRSYCFLKLFLEIMIMYMYIYKLCTYTNVSQTFTS